MLAAAALAAPASVSAFDLTDILGKGGDTAETIGNMIQGVLMKSDLDVSDLAGQWKVNGPAVSFKSENFLKKAGGVAAASVVEKKIEPYFSRLGLNGALLNIDSKGNFSLKTKLMTLQGTITKGSDESFIFNFKAFGQMSLGQIPAHIQKTSTAMDVMFDSTKIKSMAQMLAKVLNMKTLTTVTSLLDSYEGIYIGMSTEYCGKAADLDNSGADSGSGLVDMLKNGRQAADSLKNSNKKSGSNTGNQAADIEKGAGALINLLKKGKR